MKGCCLGMEQRIKCFQNGYYLKYNRGKYDEWCVYLCDDYGKCRAPKDVEYFTDLKCLAKMFGTAKVYNDFVKVYDLTGNQVSNDVLASISRLSKEYGKSAILVDIIFSILYMAMIAEENKAGTHLGKRIKRLGVHKLLIEDRTASEAADFMRGMGWREIARLCEECGF